MTKGPEPLTIPSSSGWDAHSEFKEAAAYARKALTYACGDLTEGEPTIGRHAARNHVHLRQVYQEALISNPRFAETLWWLLWHRIRDYDRLASLTQPARTDPKPSVENAPCPIAAREKRSAPDLTQVLRVIVGLVEQACMGGANVGRWPERIDEVLRDPTAAAEYADYALDLPAPLLALLSGVSLQKQP